MSKKKKPAKKGFLERVREASEEQQRMKERARAQKQKAEGKVEAAAPATPPEKTPEEKKKIHRDSIVKTVVPAIFGTIAGFISFFRLGDATDYPWLSILLFVVIAAYYAQRLIYPLIGVDTNEFGGKDWFYVEFITIDFWLVVWVLLLNPL